MADCREQVYSDEFLILLYLMRKRMNRRSQGRVSRELMKDMIFFIIQGRDCLRLV